MVKRKKDPMPERIDPMLCTLVKEVPSLPDYLFEVKWDGYRIVSYVKSEKVRMDSRSGLNYTAKYPPVEQALKALKHDVVIDGEVVVFNQEGKPDFDALQKYNGHNTPISYCVFDLLWMDGKSLMDLPLTKRKELLRSVIKDQPVLKFSESFDDGKALYEQILAENLEGIVAKRKDSVYAQGERGNDWLKIPTRKRQEFVIGAWAESTKSRSFKSLLFGAYENGKFIWIGRSGGGYKDKEMPEILKKLKALEIDKSPFANPILDTKGAVMHYVRPELVANFEFATWTKSGRIRKPATFLGFRKDKKAKDVVREVPKETEIIEAEAEETQNRVSTRKQKTASAKKKTYLNEGSNWRRVDESYEGKEVTDFDLEHCRIQLHDIEREIWSGVAKGDLALYYNRVAHYILPHLADRPQSLNLKLTHAGGPTTFIKDMENRQPACADIFTDKRRVAKAGKRNRIDYLVCNNLETLLFMVDCGCVDINTWASRTEAPETPDYIWLDLDPTVSKGDSGSEEAGFKKAVDVALAAKDVLASHKVKSLIKTSGKTGLHIYIPCQGFDFTQSRIIANALADQIHPLVKAISTRSETISLRGDRVYIDANQNDYADTLAAPYCIRPYHQPTVSTPLDWREVTPTLDRYAYNKDTIFKRLEKKGDIFSSVLDAKIAARNAEKLLFFLHR
ncbi:DNA ligase D [Dyadobacter sp. 676]|uniref:DNA ligase (ATP) n=1 Tax=Dyadobacter sp. 676 TaxID=3088362 RepID=A0AAU8FGF5_9BACT